MSEQPQQQTDPVTFTMAIDNAARLLRNAEGETNLPLMERIEKLADSWISVAGLLLQRDRDAV